MVLTIQIVNIQQTIKNRKMNHQFLLNKNLIKITKYPFQKKKRLYWKNKFLRHYRHNLHK